MSTFWIICILVITGEFQPFSDASFMWTAPLPAWNQTNPGNQPADIQTTVLRVLNGTTNYQVRWNYSLLEGQNIRSATFFILLPSSNHFDEIGDVRGGNPSINDKDGYRTRFKLESTNESSTLTITNVTERENATFQCKITTEGNTWAYNVRIEVTGTRPVISSTTSPQIGKTTPSPPIGQTTSSPSPSNSGNTIGSIVGAVLGPIAVISVIF